MPAPVIQIRRMGLLRGEPRMICHRGRYHVVFYDRETKREKWHSLGTARKEIARIRFRQIVAAYEANTFDPRRERYEFETLTIEDAAARFKKARRDRWTDATRRDYDKFLSLLVKTLPAGCQIAHLSPGDCRAFIDRPPSLAGKRGYYRRLSSFLNWCVKSRHLQYSPLEEVAEPRVPGKAPLYFTRPQIDRLVTAIRKASEIGEGRDAGLVRLERIVRFAVASGLRLAELKSLRWQDVDFTAESISVVGKGTKHRNVPLFPMSRDAAEEAWKEHEAKFGAPPPRRGEVFEGMPYHDTSRFFKRFIRSCELDERFNFHSLRKTFASWLVMDGVDIFTVSKWLGHSSVVITQKTYAHLAPGHVPPVAKTTFVGSYRGNSVASVSEDRPAAHGRIPVSR